MIGTDFNSIYFTQIRTANVNVGLLDKIFGVGTINIDTGKIETVQGGSGANRRTSTRTAYDKLLHIVTPYEVYKYFQTALTGREESLYSGRADRNWLPEFLLSFVSLRRACFNRFDFTRNSSELFLANTARFPSLK